jgi:hypothetical protein
MITTFSIPINWYKSWNIEKCNLNLVTTTGLKGNRNFSSKRLKPNNIKSSDIIIYRHVVPHKGKYSNKSTHTIYLRWFKATVHFLNGKPHLIFSRLSFVKYVLYSIVVCFHLLTTYNVYRLFNNDLSHVIVKIVAAI